MTAIVDSELTQRWLGPEGERLTEQVFRKLRMAESLDGLGLGTIEGRVDLRGITVAQPVVVHEFDAAGLRVQQRGELTKLTGVTLRNLDMSRSQLPDILLNGRYD